MRRKNIEIRDGIQKSLAIRPMGLFEISQAIGAGLNTTKKHLNYLEDLGRVRRTTFRIRGTGERVFWSLTKED